MPHEALGVWLDTQRERGDESSHPGWRDLADFERGVPMIGQKAVTG
jgi:hypothetical protein